MPNKCQMPKKPSYPKKLIRALYFFLFISLAFPVHAEYCSAAITLESSAKIAELVGNTYYELRLEALQSALDSKQISNKQYLRIFQNLKTVISLHKNEIRKGKLSRIVVQHEFHKQLRLIKLEPHFYHHHHISLCFEDNREDSRCSAYKTEIRAPSLDSYYSQIQNQSFQVTGVRMLGQYIALTLATPLIFKHEPVLHVSIIQASFATDLNQQVIARLKQKLNAQSFTVEVANISCRK